MTVEDYRNLINMGTLAFATDKHNKLKEALDIASKERDALDKIITELRNALDDVKRAQEALKGLKIK